MFAVNVCVLYIYDFGYLVLGAVSFRTFSSKLMKNARDFFYIFRKCLKYIIEHKNIAYLG